jgi:hypothetical protein
MDFKKIKELTGIDYGDIALKFGFSRQYAQQLIHRNHSLTHKAAVAFMLTTLIDEIITAKYQEIEQIELLKDEIKSEITR